MKDNNKCNCNTDMCCELCRFKTVSVTLRMTKEMRLRFNSVAEQAPNGSFGGSANQLMVWALLTVLEYLEHQEVDVFNRFHYIVGSYRRSNNLDVE